MEQLDHMTWRRFQCLFSNLSPYGATAAKADYIREHGDPDDNDPSERPAAAQQQTAAASQPQTEAAPAAQVSGSDTAAAAVPAPTEAAAEAPSPVMGSDTDELINFVDSDFDGIADEP